MELTKTKLNKILKKYKVKLEQHNKSWDALCKKKCEKKDLGNGQFEMTMPSIYDHESHNSEGATLFKDLMAEFENYEVFPKNVEQEKSDKIKSLFETYFDGCYGISIGRPTTYSMGVCKLEYNEKSNELTVHLRRPGLLIGKGGRTINKLKEWLECEILIVEVKKF